MKTKHKVNVSDLSYFIDNPERYIENDGKAYNKEAAAYGTKYHDKQLQTKFPVLKIIGVLIICSLITMYIFSILQP
jgi:hypothetical protein